jgi:hypothetical protein
MIPKGQEGNYGESVTAKIVDCETVLAFTPTRTFTISPAEHMDSSTKPTRKKERTKQGEG